MVHFIGASKPWDNRADNYNSVSFGEHVQTWWNVWDTHYVPKGSEKTTSLSHYKPPSAYEKTGVPRGPPTGSVTAAHEQITHWTPPPTTKVNGAQQHEDKPQVQVQSQVAWTQVPEYQSATPTPQSVAAEERAPTPKPTAQSTSGHKPVVWRPEARHIATRVFQDQPSNRPGARQEEFQKTWGAPSNVSSPIVPILKQSAMRPHYQYDAPFKVQGPMRPSTPESTRSLPTFDQYASYQPNFNVAGTIYVHRSEDPYTEDIRPDDEASDVSSEATYVPPFEAPKSEWDPAR